MNWVGGSRNRYMVRHDVKKQREFFEKNRMQNKLKNLGIQLPTSAKDTASCTSSMDLMTLFIVNQIASKKENKDLPKITNLNSSIRGPRGIRNEPLVLPMSPCSPSRLNFVESQPYSRISSVQGTRKRKNGIQEGFRCQQLSPVLESAFSDISASDYQSHISNALSPFSSSSASSGQGLFPMDLKLQQRGHTHPHCSTPHWDSSGLEQAKFQPFSQSSSLMTEQTPWSSRSNTSYYQLDTPTVARVLFGSPEPNRTKPRNQETNDVRFSLNQSEKNEPILEFMLSQSEAKAGVEKELFTDVYIEYGTEAAIFGRGKSKIYLKDETLSTSSRIQNTAEAHPRNPDTTSHTQLPNSPQATSSCPGPDNNTGCELSPSYSPRGGYLSSDSDCEEDGCHLCHQTGSSYMGPACSAETLHPNHSPASAPQHGLCHIMVPISQTQYPGNCCNIQQVRQNIAQPVGAREEIGTQYQSTDFVCRCKMPQKDTRHAATQTANIPWCQIMADASTQCSLVTEETNPAAINSTSVHSAVQPSTTRGQTGFRDSTALPFTQKTSSGGYRWGEGYKAEGLSASSSAINTYPAFNTECKRTTQNPHSHVPVDHNDGQGRSRQDGGDKDDRRKQGLVINAPLAEAPTEDEREEAVTSGSKVNRLSEEVETLQEIADILLMLKQRKDEG